METTGNSYSTLTEKEFFELLTHAISGSSDDHKLKRIERLEELQRRIGSNSIQDNNEAIRILLDMAKVQGYSQPESELITESFLLSINKDGRHYQTILNGLKGKGQNLLFLVFSKLVLRLEDCEKKREAIDSLVAFLMTRDGLNDIGVNEVYNCLVLLGNEELSAEIVQAVIPYLDSLGICEIVFSVRLCAKFANCELLPKMLTVLDKSMKGYFDGHYSEIEQEICQFLKRVGDARSLTPLIKLLRTRSTGQTHTRSINEAIASVLDANPSSVDEVLDTLHDEPNENVVDDLLQSLEKMEKPKINIGKLLSVIRVKWWWRYPTRDFVHSLLVKSGKLSKPVLIEILRQGDAHKYDFVLQCLKAIGISNEEISAIFPKPPMLQIYEYFYKGRGTIPKDLSQIWKEKEKIRGNVPGKTNWLEHLLLHTFQSFNFVTMNIAPLQIEGVDIVCFYPETLDLFVIGCTTGIIKDDLAKMDAMVKKMKIEISNLLDKCSVTPIVVCSEIASIPPSDAQYAVQNNIVIMQPNHIDTLLEMLNTNRQSREIIEYIKSHFTYGQYYG
jgi:hypothetical protein